MTGNEYNFYLAGYQDSDFNNSIDTSNKVDGKPIYYIKDETGKTYDSPTNAGTVYCVRCDNIKIKDLTLTKNGYSVYFWKTNNSRIENVAANSNGVGFYLQQSSSNNLTGNTANNNSGGIYIYSSSNNTLTTNTANNNSWTGIYFVLSSNNTLTGNTPKNNNAYGIYFSGSNSNLIFNNYFNNSNNVYDNGNNIWNTSRTDGTNIIGGPYLGGNYWFDYPGYDLDGDGIGDTNLPHKSSGIINGGDYMPLVRITDIASCRNISVEGEYRLVRNITDSPSTVCINITSSDVIFNGAGYTIDGIGAGATYGIYIYNSTAMLTNVTVRNVMVTDWGTGTYHKAQDGSIVNVEASDNTVGIYLGGSSSIAVTDNTAKNNTNYGIALNGSSSITISGNTLENNTGYGIYLNGSTSNAISNNYFSNPNNSYDDGQNIWNISKTKGTNIIGGPYLGGNYWSDYTGSDTDSDGLGNTDVPYNSSGHIVNSGDYLPLVINEIDSCTNITEPGVYKLNRSISNSPAASCINITSSDVFFDGAGNTIDGINAAGSSGVYVYNSTSLITNVVVNNVVVTDWDAGILCEDSVNGYVTNNAANNNSYRGIYLNGSSSITISDNTINYNEFGIDIYKSENNTITVNNANSNSRYGINLLNSSNNSLYSNVANNNSQGGIYFESSSSNNVISNTINNNSLSIVIYQSNNNNLNGNTAENNSIFGIALGYSSNNTIYNNYFSNYNNTYIEGNGTNAWNTVLTSGTNIVGGPYLGGNFWAYPNGTGFSQTCADINKNGICDSSLTLNDTNIDQLPLAPEPVVTPAPPTPSPGSSSSSGGGGGGGGVVSGEPFENIARSESRENDLIINSSVIFNFSKMEAYNLAVTGIANEGAVTIKVEELKGTSKLVQQQPPGTVYRNFNIWSGSKKIKEALIRYRVENSWLTLNNLASSDVKILRWVGGKWVQLDTGEINRDGTYTYFEAKTEGFSHFAVSGIKGDIEPVATTPSTSVTSPTSVQTTSAQSSGTAGENVSTNFVWIIALMAVLVIVAAVYILARKKKGD
ncbi:Periplasmic copper-binding protein (NosD) [uncultured archaeon]|nr:Periplasmic copper-binding protein (NosD) [uncultured archaeon]